MNARARPVLPPGFVFVLGFVLLGGLLPIPTARAEDPPALDILATLRLEPGREVAGLASANHLPCTVREGSPLGTFAAGDAVFLISLGSGSFRVVPDTQGVLACVVGETVHVLDFLSPRRALDALGLEASDDLLAEGASLSTRVVDPGRLLAHGIASEGVGDLASVHVRGGGIWSVSTFGRKPSHARVDIRPFYAPQAPVGDALERATVELALDALPERGRLLARVADPTRLVPHGIHDMPAGELVRLRRGAGEAWTLTTLSPGFTREVSLVGLDAEALGLEGLRLLDLPVGGSARGRLRYAWKAAKEGLEGARPRDLVAVVRETHGRYVLKNLDPRRPGTAVLADGR